MEHSHHAIGEVIWFSHHDIYHSVEHTFIRYYWYEGLRSVQLALNILKALKALAHSSIVSYRGVILGKNPILIKGTTEEDIKTCVIPATGQHSVRQHLMKDIRNLHLSASWTVD